MIYRTVKYRFINSLGENKLLRKIKRNPKFFGHCTFLMLVQLHSLQLEQRCHSESPQKVEEGSFAHFGQWFSFVVLEEQAPRELCYLMPLAECLENESNVPQVLLAFEVSCQVTLVGTGIANWVVLVPLVKVGALLCSILGLLLPEVQPLI